MELCKELRSFVILQPIKTSSQAAHFLLYFQRCILVGNLMPESLFSLLSFFHLCISLSFTSFVRFSAPAGQVLLGKCLVNSCFSSDHLADRHQRTTNSGLTKLCLLEQFNVKAARLFYVLCHSLSSLWANRRGAAAGGARAQPVRPPTGLLREDFTSSTINTTQTLGE